MTNSPALSRATAISFLCFLGIGAAISTASAAQDPSRSPVEIPAGQAGESRWPEGETKDPSRLASGPSRGGSTLTVGTGPGCNYTNLGSALLAAGSGDVIRLSESGEYFGETYSILNFDGQLTIQGGFEDCTTTNKTTKTVLDANDSGRVFYIEQNTVFSGSFMQVTIEDVEVINGNNTGSFGGGGMLVNGQPGVLDVQLNNVTVRDNQSSTRGGGIHLRVNADRQGTGTMLTLDNSSKLLSNSSGENGGGIACSSLGSALSTDTLLRLGSVPIQLNTAVNGAGIYIDGCKRVFAYAGRDVSLAGSIVDNDASGDGGGISVVNGGEAFVRGDSFSGFGIADGAAEILSNSAATGAGAHVSGDGSFLSLDDAVLDRNQAEFRGGGALVEQLGFLRIRRLENQPCQETGPSGNPRCSRIVDNSVTSGGNGALALEANSGGEIEVTRTEITGHTGGGISRLVSIDSRVAGSADTTTGWFEGVAVHGNSGLGAVFVPNNSAVLTLGWSTIAGNEANNVVRTGSGDADIDIYASIIRADSGAVVERGGQGSVVASLDCVIGHQPQGDLDVDSFGYYSNIDPEFIDAAGGNVRLGPTSPAIDYCDDFNAPQHAGLDGNDRGVAHRGEPLTSAPGAVLGGTYDLGAFEMTYVIDELFQDRFE